MKALCWTSRGVEGGYVLSTRAVMSWERDKEARYRVDGPMRAEWVGKVVTKRPGGVS